MNTLKDREAVLAAWLDDGPATLPADTRHAIAVGIRTVTRRRSGIAWPFAGRGVRTIEPRRLSVALGGAAVVVVAAALALNFYAKQPGLGGPVPTADPRSSFQGTWVSTSDTDGGTQTMTVRAAADGTVEIVGHDDVASVCSGTPSTTTGTGRIEDSDKLVIPAPVYTCDDGSEPVALSGPPLQEQLRNLTFVRDARTDTLTDNFGGVWRREGAEAPSPQPTISGSMWPQSSLEEVRQAQERADAGDPAYAWQVDPNLSSEDWWGYLRDPGAEIVVRFLREELGWDHALLHPYSGDYPPGDDGDGAADGVIRGVAYLRCAPGETNPLYPIAGPFDSQGGDQCAPTIDDLRYETMTLDLTQLDRRGPSGIWVVSRSERQPPPFAQADPRVVEKLATARLEDFLEARIQGKGAEGYGRVSQGWSTSQELPLLYATTSGAPYERFEIERVEGPYWPFGTMKFNVRLFAEGGATVVEELIRVIVDGGQAELGYLPIATTENGQPVAVSYAWFDGAVTARAAHPWAEYTDYALGLALNKNWDERVNLVGDPSPLETGCEPGPAPADAEALATAIRSDPDFEATAPVTVRVGGIEALRMDVIAAPRASVCEAYPAPVVLQGDGGDHYGGLTLKEGSRMRLYLLDVPEGSSIGVLAIAIVAPEARFELVVQAATPVLDSVEFHAP